MCAEGLAHGPRPFGLSPRVQLVGGAQPVERFLVLASLDLPVSDLS